MQSILIQTNSKSTQKLLIQLAQKLGNKVSILKPSMVEDLAFGTMIQDAKTGKTVSKKSIVSLLNH